MSHSWRLLSVLLFCVANWALICFFALSAYAQAPPPITSSGLNTQISAPLPAPSGQTQYNITGGTRPGGGPNLFHSFGNFNVPNNNIANFLNETGLPTSNILGRITGGNLSSILGTIQTTGFGNANLFLMNPAGFLFGPNATVNVGGMVSFSSADYLRLADGVRFNAVPNAAADALLSTAPVAAYGFLGSNPGAITVQGSQLTVADGTGISLVGGNITIQSGTPDSGVPQPARLLAPNGKIQLATAASPGEFEATTLHALPNINGASFTSFGSVTLAPGSNINISGQSTVSIQGGQFVLSANDAVMSTAQEISSPETISLTRGSSIVTSNAGTDAGADVLMAASKIQLDGVSVLSRTLGDGHGGSIRIQGEQVALTGGTQIVTAAEGTGKGGDLVVSAVESVNISGFDSDATLVSPVGFSAPLTSGLFTLSSNTGAGGDINVSARTITVEDNGTIFSLSSGDGRGGSLSLNGEKIVLQNEALLLSSSGQNFLTGEFTGNGAGGDIHLNATESIKIVGPANPTLLGQTSVTALNWNTGEVGSVSVIAPTVTLQRGATIATANNGTGAGGNISISAANLLTVTEGSTINTSTFTEANSGNIVIEAGSAHLSDKGSISTASFGFGTSNPGDINFHTTSELSITGSAAISTTGGPNSSGTIRISADSLLVSGSQSEPFTPTTIANNGGAVSTGDVEITSRVITVSDNARINMEGFGQLGTIAIKASEAVSIASGAKLRMENSSGTSGTAGSIVVMSPNITLEQAIIQTRTVTGGDAGSVSLQGDRINLLGGQINSDSTNSTGKSGDVTVVAHESLSISGRFSGNDLSGDKSGSAGIFTSANSLGDAANITVLAPQIQLANGGVLSALSTGSGKAGNINVQGIAGQAQSVLLDGAGSGIFTDTHGTGAGGSITVNANTVTLQNGGTLSAATSGTAPSATGGSITVNAAALTLNTGGNITASSTGTGAAGDVTVQCQCHNPAQSVLIDGNGSGIFTDTQGTGPGGSIFVNANAFTLQNGGMISAATSGTAGTATGGTITINANQAQLNSGATITTATSGPGDAGSILVKADSVGMNGGATITASSTGSGAAGSVTIQGNAAPAQSIVIDGTGGGIFTDTQASGAGGSITTWSNQLQLSNGSTISSKTSGSGNAGNILLKADDITISGGSAITAASTGSGNAGTVTIQGTHSPANSFLVDGFNSGIFTTTSSSGTGGNIVVNSNDVVLENGATISAKSSGNATQAVGGTITINAGDTVTLNAATITASSSGVADAGSINITANNGLSMQGSSITTEAGQGAGGGNINVTTSPAATVILQNSTISASVADGPGGGGNITIDPNYVILQNSQILARAADGQGGAISITAGLFLPDGSSVVNADSGSGVNGTVTIQSPVSPASGKILPLQQTPLIAASFMTQRCAALTGGNFSTFTVAGRDTLPTEPGGWLSSPLTLATMTEHKGLEAKREQETPLLSLRQIAPPGFLTRSFAVESSGCQS